MAELPDGTLIRSRNITGALIRGVAIAASVWLVLVAIGAFWGGIARVAGMLMAPAIHASPEAP